MSKEQETKKMLAANYEKAIKEKTGCYFETEEIILLAEYYNEIGKLNYAHNVLELGLQLHPYDYDMQIQMAAHLLDTQRVEEALEILETIEEKNVDIEYFKGEALARLGKIEESYKLFKKLIETQQDDPDLFGEIAFIFSSKDEPTKAKYFLEKGIEIFPDDQRLLINLAILHQESGKLDKALKIFNHILDIDPYNDLAWLSIGYIYVEKRELPKAIEAFDFAISIDDESPEAWLQKALCHSDLTDTKEAIKAFEKYLKIVPNDVDILLAYANELFKDKETKKAIKIYKKAAKLDKNNPDGYLGMCVCNLEMGNIEQCFDDFATAVKIDPHYKKTHIIGKQIKLQLDNIDSEENTQYEAENDPDSYEYVINVGMKHVEDEEYEKALPYLEKAFDIDPSRKLIAAVMARCYYYTGQYDKMRDFCKIEKKNNPKTAKIIIHSMLPEEAYKLLKKNKK